MTDLTSKELLFDGDHSYAQDIYQKALLDHFDLEQNKILADEATHLKGLATFSKELLEKSDNKYVPDTVSDTYYESMFENEYFCELGKLYIYAKQSLEKKAHSSFFEEFGREVCLKIAAIESNILHSHDLKQLDKAEKWADQKKPYIKTGVKIKKSVSEGGETTARLYGKKDEASLMQDAINLKHREHPTWSYAELRRQVAKDGDYSVHQLKRYTKNPTNN